MNLLSEEEKQQQKAEREMARDLKTTNSLMERCSFVKFKDVGEIDLNDLLSEDDSKLNVLYKNKAPGFKYELQNENFDKKPTSSESLVPSDIQKTICEYMNTRISGEQSRLNGKGSMNGSIERALPEIKQQAQRFADSVEGIKSSIKYMENTPKDGVSQAEFNRRKGDVANITLNLEDALENKEGSLGAKALRRENKSFKGDIKSAQMRMELSMETSPEPDAVAQKRKEKNRLGIGNP